MRRRLAFALLAGLASAPALPAPEGPPPLVIGQSLPLTGPAFPIANRVQAGAKALVDRVNAAGGVNGRRLELLTLDDGGDRARLAANLRSLVQRQGALAVVNCLGELACAEASAVTRELGVPLVGPFSGAAALRAPALKHVYTLRPDDRREAEALVRQLASIGIARLAWLADGDEPAREAALAQALGEGGVQATRIAVRPQAESLEAAWQAVAQAAPQALLLSLGPATLDAIRHADLAARRELPATVATLSSAGLTQATRLFRGKVIGFTSVVPIPEISQLPLVREFERDADAFVGPEAFSFEGLASYLHLRVLAEALRRAGPRPDTARLADAIEGLGSVDFGGWRLRFGPDRHHGSEHLEIGLRARDGKLRR
jgi:branched-chain amino acid transport system substrate-binding protein